MSTEDRLRDKLGSDRLATGRFRDNARCDVHPEDTGTALAFL